MEGSVVRVRCGNNSVPSTVYTTLPYPPIVLYLYACISTTGLQLYSMLSFMRYWMLYNLSVSFVVVSCQCATLHQTSPVLLLYLLLPTLHVASDLSSSSSSPTIRVVCSCNVTLSTTILYYYCCGEIEDEIELTCSYDCTVVLHS